MSCGQAHTVGRRERSRMGCLLALLAGFAPRVALALVWIAEFVWFAMPGVGRRGLPPRSPRLAAAHTRLASITATQNTAHALGRR